MYGGMSVWENECMGYNVWRMSVWGNECMGE